MKTSTIVWIVIIIIVVGGVSYWWSTQQSPTPASPSTTTGLNGSPDQGNLGGNASNSVQQPTGDGSSPSQNLTLGLNSNAKLGQYLIAYNGMTLYTFAKDKKGTTTCYSACATNWPPYIVTPGMQINLQAGIDGAFSTVTRTDGTMQLAYKGMPLYFYAKDAVSGDTKGEGVGKVWYVVKP